MSRQTPLVISGPVNSASGNKNSQVTHNFMIPHGWACLQVKFGRFLGPYHNPGERFLVPGFSGGQGRDFSGSGQNHQHASRPHAGNSPFPQSSTRKPGDLIFAMGPVSRGNRRNNRCAQITGCAVHPRQRSTSFLPTLLLTCQVGMVTVFLRRQMPWQSLLPLHHMTPPCHWRLTYGLLQVTPTIRSTISFIPSAPPGVNPPGTVLCMGATYFAHVAAGRGRFDVTRGALGVAENDHGGRR